MIRSTTRKIALTAAAPASRRCLHAASRCLAKATPAPAVDAPAAPADRIPTPKEIATRRADGWLKDEDGGAGFRDARQAKFVGNGDRPFPMNPYFRPQAPLSDATRTEIFRLYVEDAQQWSPRALAEQFGLSIVRVQAILRLKALQKKWVDEKIPLQTNLTEGMELMLNAKTLLKEKHAHRARESLRLTPAKRLVPFFRMMNEEEAFTPADAAELMQMEPYANLQRKLDEAADHVFELESPKANPPKVLEVNKALKSKFQFMLVDTGNIERTNILIREKDGRLRHASVEEKFRRKNLKPKYIM